MINAVFCGRKSSGAKLMARGLRIPRFVGHNLRLPRTMLSPVAVLLNWGSSRYPTWSRPGQRLLNSPEAVRVSISKVRSYEKFREAGVPTLEFATDVDTAQGWHRAGQRVLIRRDGRSGGDGIQIVGRNQPWPDRFHGDFFTRYFPKTHEFRVHVAPAPRSATTTERATQDALPMQPGGGAQRGDRHPVPGEGLPGMRGRGGTEGAVHQGAPDQEGPLRLRPEVLRQGGRGLAGADRGMQEALADNRLGDIPGVVREFQPGEREVVHSLRTIDLVQKKRSLQTSGELRMGGRGLFQRIVRSHGNGWIFAHNDLHMDDDLYQILEAYAIQAVQCLGLDFGAVDIAVRDADGVRDVRVLEVNTAPGLDSQITINAYLEAFAAL